MRRLVAVISGLLMSPAFAEVKPIFYEEVVEYSMEEPSEEATVTEEETTEEEKATPVVPTAVSPRSASGRAATSRTVVSNTTTKNVTSRAVPASSTVSTSARNVIPTRSVTARTAVPTTTSATNTVRQTTTNSVRSSRPTVTNSQATNIVSTRRTNQNNTVTARAAVSSPLVQTDTVNKPLYNARVGISSSNISARIPTIRTSGTINSTSSATQTSTTATATSMDELAQITDFCKAQYMECMDNFCNVLDENQGRCSCSANLTNYAKTEAALKQATEELQEVAQSIQYIGLSADEVETLFTQTEAELQMQTSKDNSQLKSDLDKIKELIVEAAPTTNTGSSSGIGLDLSGLLDFSLDSTGFDLSSLLGTSSSSINNQRGEELYKTATARCKASVLNSCAAQGVDTTVITNAYDLEIDKQCIAYEKSLIESNDQMSATVRNAKSVLQKARLLVAQQKNAYDLRGCINALDSCMQDDFVCGTDYENCLDPSGKFIVNGEIVIGSQPGPVNIDSNTPGSISGLYKSWVYGTNSKYAWAQNTANGDLSNYISETVTSKLPENQNSSSISEFLQNKIGYNKDDKNYGMCMSVLNKCQDVTYSGTGSNKKYAPDNNVIKEYLQRTLVQIKAKQDELLSEYAEDCIVDVSTCLAQNSYNTSTPTSITIAVKACNSVIKTCMSVTDAEESTPEEWVNAVLNNKSCPSNSTGTYPNCVCTSGEERYLSGYNLCVKACPSENGDPSTAGQYTVGCKCKTGYTYDKESNTCTGD